MKPQLLAFDVAGKNNADLKASHLRIVESGVWKKQRVIVILPAGGMMPTKAAMAQWSMIFPPNQGVYKIAALGMEVGEAYSQAIESILAHPELSTWEYILTVEHDNLPPADGVLKLIARMEAHPEFDCIGGLYWTKGEGTGVPQIWGDKRDPQPNSRPQPPDPNGGLVECWGTGMGFNLWRLAMFKDPNLRRPWFKTISGSAGNATQDLYFWQDAQKHGHRCAIDCGVLVGHYDVATDTNY